MRPIHLLYSGGSGGHICAHLILTSKKHFCAFKNLDSVTTVVDFYTQFDHVKHQQWQITESNIWKTFEFWPDNHSTKKIDIPGLEKFYLTCNPEQNICLDKSHCNVLIYTDIDTHFDLAMYKRSNFFLGIKNIKNECYQMCNKVWHQRYGNVKDISWPCIDLKDILELPDYIKVELVTCHEKFQCFMDWTQHNDSAKTWKEIWVEDHGHAFIENDAVVNPVPGIANQVDHAVKLQNVIKSNGKILLDSLGLDHSHEHKNLVNHWLSLHDQDLQNRLLT